LPKDRRVITSAIICVTAMYEVRNQYPLSKKSSYLDMRGTYS